MCANELWFTMRGRAKGLKSTDTIKTWPAQTPHPISYITFLKKKTKNPPHNAPKNSESSRSHIPAFIPKNQSQVSFCLSVFYNILSTPITAVMGTLNSRNSSQYYAL